MKTRKLWVAAKCSPKSQTVSKIQYFDYNYIVSSGKLDQFLA